MTLSARAVRVCGWIPLAFTFSYLIEAHTASAAPFCIRNTALPPQCIYYDPTDCRKQALKQGGWCEPNPSETRTASGGTGQYCLVLAQGEAICAFLSRESCDVEATRLQGACYHNEARGTGAPDPYAAFSGPTLNPGAAETP
jgi:hypothetical protein